MYQCYLYIHLIVEYAGMILIALMFYLFQVEKLENFKYLLYIGHAHQLKKRKYPKNEKRADFSK
ncbi:hypothetical protein DN390_07650 [Bacillus sp. SH7-1]|nr:hypothetical protein DN390_07650 [Bacillus sp. SH7-1]